MDPQVHIFHDAKPGFTLADAVGYISGIAPDDYGYIWLRHENGTRLAIMIKGQQTYPHFFCHSPLPTHFATQYSFCRPRIKIF
jgi:hypothetical protein